MLNKRLFRFLLILSSLSFLGALALYPQIPAFVPTNWNFEGNVDTWGPKWTSLFLAFLPFLCTVGLYFVPRIDPRKKNFARHPKAYNAITAVTVLVFIALSWAITLPALGIRLPVDKAILVLVGILLIGMGNYMPQVRSNFFMGFRTPWALSSDEVWQKTHRAGGIVFCAGGILMVVSVFFPYRLVLLFPLGFILAGSIGICLYSYYLYKKVSIQGKNGGKAP